MSPPTYPGDFYEHKARLPGPGPRRPGRRPFGASWWGKAWVEALEQRAQLDPNRLPRGRTYARSGAVGALTLASGEISAEVQGSRRTPYSVKVRVRTFDQSDWERLLDALSTEIGHTAALLDGELPPEVADDIASVGLDLLPGPGELQPRCSCPDWADPCKHSAAVCYLVADELDSDPFGLLLLRGLGRPEVLAGLRSRRRLEAPPSAAIGAVAEGVEGVDEGVLVREAWSRTAGPVPPVPPPPRRPGPPSVLAADPPPDCGVDLSVLRALAADAAGRALALALARGPVSSGLELDASEDLARRAASRLAGPDGPPDSSGLVRLARQAGVPEKELVRRAVAFRHGGREGLAVLKDHWDPEAAALAPGRGILGSGAVVRHNRVTKGERQLRLGRDGRWYPYSKDKARRWSPDGPPITAPRPGDLGDLDDFDDFGDFDDPGGP